MSPHSAPKLDRRQMLKAGATIAGLSLGGRALAQSDRIESLIRQMTPAEKAGQLSCFSDQIRPIGLPFNPGLPARNDAAAQLARIRKGEIGMLFNGVGYAGARAAQDAMKGIMKKHALPQSDADGDGEDENE